MTTGFLDAFSKALCRGLGSSLKVGTVAWGRHSDGLAISRKTLMEPERFRFMFSYMTPAV